MLLPTSVVVWLGWISIPSLAVAVSLLVTGLSTPEFSEVFQGVASVPVSGVLDTSCVVWLSKFPVLLRWSRSFVFPRYLVVATLPSWVGVTSTALASP